jgi:DNA-binding CsgD family transcriptional regulator/PAS domain-containing protein
MDRHHSDLAQLSQVIGLIYEGATDPSRWTRDILPAMAEYMQAPGVLLFSSLHTPQNGGYLFLHGIAQEQMDLYMHKYQAEDVWTLTALEKNLYTEGNVVIGEEHVPRAQLMASNFYKEWMARDQNLGQLLASVVFGADSSSALPAVCSYVRGFHHPDFGETERQRQQLLLPHISRSLGVMQRLRCAELTVATTLAALDRLPSGVLLLDGAGRLSFVNHAARQMLEKRDGLRLSGATHASALGELDADDVSAGRAIGAAIRSALKRDPFDTPHFSRSVIVPHKTGMGHYTLQFSTLGQQNEFGGAQSGHAAIVFIADSVQKTAIDARALQDAYGLTSAECRVAITLLEHVSAKEVARVLDVSHHTVRSQTQRIYAKLGVDTRARFVKVMLGLANQPS